jgi:DNA polymerase/3'-5' exonuclease PolX
MSRWFLYTVLTMLLWGGWGVLSKPLSEALSSWQVQTLSTLGLLPVVALLAGLIEEKLIEKRLTKAGTTIWGARNKFARHIASGIPVDFFEANRENWFNLLVCRTGSAEHNIRVAAAAKARGWRWDPYSAGVWNENGEMMPVRSERALFDILELMWRESRERG